MVAKCPAPCRISAVGFQTRASEPYLHLSMYTARHLLIQFSTIQFFVTVYAERQRFAISRNHKALPIVDTFQVFELPDMMNFNLTISFAAELALPCGQPIHQTGFAGIFHCTGDYINGGGLLHWLSCKAIIVKQPCFLFSFLSVKRTPKFLPIRSLEIILLMLVRYFVAKVLNILYCMI